MAAKTPWWVIVDPETGRRFIDPSPYYTWESGWGVMSGVPTRDPETQRLFVELKPITPLFADGSAYDYASVRVPVELDPEVPRPSNLRPLSRPEMLTLMLSIISVKFAPVLGGPFISGIVKRRVPSRESKYKAAIVAGSPTNFAIVVREEAERWRQLREISPRETGFLKRVYWDMCQEVALSRNAQLTSDEVVSVVNRAFGGNPLGQSRRKIRVPRPPKRGEAKKT